MRGPFARRAQHNTTHNTTYLKLCIGPPWNLNNHVEDGLLLIGIERDIVEGRDADAILGDVDSVLEGVGGTNLVGFVLGGHGGGGGCICICSSVCICRVGRIVRRRMVGHARKMTGYLKGAGVRGWGW